MRDYGASIRDIVRSSLFVPKQYIQPTWSTFSNRIIILVHRNWLSLLIENNSVPKFLPHDYLTDEEIEAALLMGHDVPSMQRVLIQVITKPGASEKAICLPSPRSRRPKEDAGLSYPQLLHYVSHTNFKNLWKHQYKRYLGDKTRRHKDSIKTLSTRNAYFVLRDIIVRFYGCPVIDLDKKVQVFDGKVDLQAHINILPAACVVETSGYALVLHTISVTATLKDFVTFSPGVFMNDLNKPMFIAYQILQAFRDSHDRAVIMGDIRLEDIYISNDLFIQIIPRIESNLFQVTPEDLICGSEIPRSPVDDSLSSITQKWAHGDVSNFEYIMRLNEAAGRRFGNPSCHFILPWVSDLSTRSNGVWRDLSRSKFRLNKGDRQLDLTYEHAPSSQPPHHVTDVLSEITYYVYLARRTSQTVLCKYVRPLWVPAEYPVSIQRLYAWTPDECIPEFYTDPSIFKSIHEDLCDLELPPWAPTPEEFIKSHREQLESRRVSEKLHHWIDLTFGYKLTGAAAIKAKNVCLHLADSHSQLATSGVVQVFTHPHPRKLTPLAGFDKQPPKHRKTHVVADDDCPHSSEADDDDGVDSKASPLLLHRLSRTSLLAPFQSSSEETLGVRSSTGSASSATGSTQTTKQNQNQNHPVAGCLDNPLALLNAIESNFNFHLRTFGTLPAEPNIQSGDVKLKKMIAGKRLQEMQIFGCLVLELFLYAEIRTLNTSDSANRIKACFGKINSENLPHSIRSALRLLLDNYPPVTNVGLPPPSAHQILQPLLFSSILPFAVSMPLLYNVVAKLRTLERYQADVELRVRFIADELKNVISSINVDLAFPFVKNLLEDSATDVSQISSLLDKVLSFLGVNRTNEHFLETLVGLYERLPMIPQLYQQKFLLILMIRCGMKNFVNYFVPLIVEATGKVINHALKVPHDDEESSPETEERPSIEPKPELGIFAFDREDTPSDGESLQNLMEQLTGISDDDEEHIVHESEMLHGLRSPPIPVGTHAQKLLTIECDIGSRNSDGPVLSYNQKFVNSDGLSVNAGEQSIHEIAANSILWMSRRLGPVLTAKHVTRNLLKMLTLCYTGSGALSPSTSVQCDELSIARHKIVGDENADYVLQCLKQLVELYGEQIILVQYFPFMSDLIVISKRKLTYGVEGGVVGVLALLRNVVSLLSDATLMDNLQDVILKDILHPLVRLMMTVRNPFPSGYLGRMALATKILDTLYFLAVHIGAEMTRVHLAVPSLQKFFLAFDRAIGLRVDLEELEKIDSQTAGDELRRVFCPGLAHSAYLAFFRLLGEGAMQSSLVNHDFIRRLCLQHEKQLDPSSKQRNICGVYSIDFLSSEKSSVSVIGNKIEIQEDVENVAKNSKDVSRHIRGNWLAYWEHEIGRSDKDTRFNFKQIKLQTFSGHTHAIRCLEVLDNENSLVSGSRDKTVKLWSLRSQGDGSANSSCKFTYNAHRKSLIGVAYLPGPRLIASCDSSLHFWDPFVGKPVSLVEGKAPSTALKAVDNLVIVGTSDSALRVVDARVASNVAELKLNWSPGGLVRCICSSRDGTWVAVGQSSGYITVLRLRTALVIASWKAHEGEVLQITAVDDNTILSTSLDQSISVWNIHDGKIKFHLKGPTEPVHCLKTHGSELITGTTANRIGVHTGVDIHAGFSSTKLRSDTFKGVLTSMALLSLNMQLVLGTDTGHISLLC